MIVNKKRYSRVQKIAIGIFAFYFLFLLSVDDTFAQTDVDKSPPIEIVAATVTILIIISFFCGTAGTYIHNLNVEREWKREQANTNQLEAQAQPPPQVEPPPNPPPNNPIKKFEHGYHPLLGGSAGLLILASFEGLSVLFAGAQMVPKADTMIVLIGTCFAAGFAPMEVVERATRQWRTKAEAREQGLQASREELERGDQMIPAIKTELESIIADAKNALERLG